MTATIKDVAKKAGVSVSTVSLVINNKPGVNETTRQRILKAIKELNYHPHYFARGLASKRKGNIGFILTNYHFSRAEPFYTKIFLGSELEARNHNYYILLTTVESKFSRKDVPRFLSEKNVDGVILAGKIPTGLIEYLSHFDLPVIFIDYVPPRGKYLAVLMDNVDGAIQAITHLIKKGHQKIAFVGGDIGHPSIHSRLKGYKLALEKHGIRISEDLIVATAPDTTSQYGYQSTCDLLDKKIPFTAIFATNDAMAFGCMKCLREKHIRVPDQVALIGFDDVEIASQMDPKLTTIRVNKEDIGSIAVKTMVDIINSNRKLQGRFLVPVELVVRNST
ncbi:MAG: LacI family transcriptional regulator [Calditrichaeota bacterium]|nr:LacI family transcriptional regulator [Calditrichota bacterium]